MEKSILETLFKNDKSLNLLKKTQAPYVLGFLFKSFKKQERTEISSSDLVADLANYQGELRRERLDALAGTPESILSQWTTEDEILSRSHDPQTDKYVFTLTDASEKALQFVEQLHDKGRPVAAESSLIQIVQMLENVVLTGSGDPESQIRKLEAKRDEIQKEIDLIKETGAIEMSPYQIREGVRQISYMIRRLSGEFRKVEEDFQGIAKDLQQAQGSDGTTKGDLVEYAIENELQIRENDTGKSFYGFFALLNSPERQRRLDYLREELRGLGELTGMDLSDIMNFDDRLNTEAQRVNKTIQRLSRQLRRALDDKANAQRQALLERIEKAMTGVRREDFSVGNPNRFISVDAIERIRSYDDYNPYTPPPELQKPDATLYENDLDSAAAAFSEMAKLQALSIERLTGRIIQVLEDRSEPSLSISQLVADIEPEHGVIELMGYLQIASENGIPINSSEKETVHIKSRSGSELAISVPLVVFHKNQLKVSQAS